MSQKASTQWTGGMAFDSFIDGHLVVMDADKQWGGEDLGVRPKKLLLAALSGCTGMDVVSILEKMRIKNYKLRIDVDADSTSDQPVTYHTIRTCFHFSGDDLPSDKVVKAVNLSIERYCGVHAMLKRAANIITKVYINDTEVMA